MRSRLLSLAVGVLFVQGPVRANEVLVQAYASQVTVQYVVFPGIDLPSISLELIMKGEFRVPTFSAGTSLDSALVLSSGGMATYAGVTLLQPNYWEVHLNGDALFGSTKQSIGEEGWNIGAGSSGPSSLKAVALRWDNAPLVALDYSPDDFVSGSAKDLGGYVPVYFEVHLSADAFTFGHAYASGGAYIAPISLSVLFTSQELLTPEAGTGVLSTQEQNQWYAEGPTGTLPTEYNSLLPGWVPIATPVPEDASASLMLAGLACIGAILRMKQKGIAPQAKTSIDKAG